LQQYINLVSILSCVIMKAYRMGIYILLLLWMVGAAAGCTREPVPVPAGRRFVDMRGRELYLRSVPRRIVSLAPSNTEIVFALGKGDSLVGVTNQCDYPKEARAIKKVGDFNAPDIELILSCNPDIILAGNAIPDKALHFLQGAGLTVAVTEAFRLDGIFQSIGELGDMLGVPGRAEKLTARMREKIDSIHTRVEKQKPVSCYYMISFGKQGNWTVGPGSFVDELIALAGGYNIAHTLPGPWVNMDIELLLAADPEVIIAGGSAGDVRQLSQLPLYNRLRAVRQGSVFVLDESLITRPGPRITQGLELLARTLHPEVFSVQTERNDEK
jgi:iron complex transport system substrate-binding protein